MKKNISRNPLWPDWYNGKKIDEVQFGRAFLEQWPLKCVNGTLYTLDGPVEDESEIKQRILENIEEYVTSGLSKKVTNILETIKLLAFSDPFPIEQDCIHLQNGVYHLPDGSFQESRLFCQNRLPVRYEPKAASPDRWLTFLHELLDDADIPTLQEYLGYRRSVSAPNCARMTAAITLKPPTTSTCPVAAGCGDSWASNRLSTPARKKCIFSRKKFVQPVRSVLVRTCTANWFKLKRVIVYILDFCTPYRPYRLYEVRTDFLYPPKKERDL